MVETPHDVVLAILTKLPDFPGKFLTKLPDILGKFKVSRSDSHLWAEAINLAQQLICHGVHEVAGMPLQLGKAMQGVADVLWGELGHFVLCISCND